MGGGRRVGRIGSDGLAAVDSFFHLRKPPTSRPTVLYSAIRLCSLVAAPLLRLVAQHGARAEGTF